MLVHCRKSRLLGCGCTPAAWRGSTMMTSWRVSSQTPSMTLSDFRSSSWWRKETHSSPFSCRVFSPRHPQLLVPGGPAACVVSLSLLTQTHTYSNNVLQYSPLYLCVQDVPGEDAAGGPSWKVHVSLHRLLHVGGCGAEEHDPRGERGTGGTSGFLCSQPLLA